MGNYTSKKTAKVMKINGETTKLKTPIKSIEITNNHPGYVLLDSQTVKHYGIRAQPLDPSQYLEPGRLYFLVELPKFPDGSNHHHHSIDIHRVPRRVRSSGIHLSAKDRLESLMLSRRSVSDLSMMRPAGSVVVGTEEEEDLESCGGGVRVKMRLPRVEVERLMNESKSKDEAAEKIMDLYGGYHVSSSSRFKLGEEAVVVQDSCQQQELQLQLQQQRRIRNGDVNRVRSFQQQEGYRSGKKRVGFMPINESEIQLAVAS